MKSSIKRQLLLRLLIPLMTLAMICTVAAYFVGQSLAREIYDKQLLNSADSVVARLKVNGNTLTADLPPAARSLLRHNDKDEFYFQIFAPNGDFISGDKFLPLTDRSDVAEPEFRTIQYQGQELRIAVLKVPTPGHPSPYVIVQLAETRNTRRELINKITASVLFAQLLLIISGAIAIWFGVRQSLQPLAKVEKAVEARSPKDLRPLDVDEPAEIASLVKALNRLLGQLADDIDLQKRFLSNAAHQLRTPIAVLGTYCDLASKIAKEPEAREALADLHAAIQRMGRLVNRLLVLARSEPSVASHRPFTVFDLNSVASVVTAAHVPEAIKKKIELEFVTQDHPAFVLGEQNSIEEMLSNLIENSIIYTPVDGTVRVEVTSNGFTELKVEDTGPGIPEEERKLVFERFYRVPGTEQPGTGLGLAIVNEIIAAHRASISIEDGRGGKGTSIKVKFPVPETLNEIAYPQNDKIEFRKQQPFVSGSTAQRS
jgi:two-component system, OmpR family, sensor histidine kinase TctE